MNRPPSGLVLLAHQWRSAWELDPDELKEAAERLDAWRRVAVPERAAAAWPSQPPEPVAAILAVDLDTPAALQAVDELARAGDEAGVAAPAAEVLGVRLDPSG